MKTFLIGLIASIVAVFAPIQGALATVLVLCLADMVTGIIAARKAGETITSAGMARTAVKLFVFESVILLTFLGEAFLHLDTLLPAVKICSALIASTELLSIYENLNRISGGKLLVNIIKKFASKNDTLNQKVDEES